MERLEDLNRLKALAQASQDQAEYAKIEAKIQKTLAANQAEVAKLPAVEPAEFDESAAGKQKRGKS